MTLGIIDIFFHKRETRPALGPKGLIVKKSVTPVCATPLVSEARILLGFTVHDTLARAHYFVVHSGPIIPVAVPWSGTLRSCTWYHAHGTVRYRTDFELTFAKFTLRNLLLYSVLYNAHWRSSSLVKNLERQWQNGWCLTWRLAMSVASQVPIFFGFSAWCNSLARDIGFKYRLYLERPLLGVEHEEKEMQIFSSIFGEEALLRDGFLRDKDSRNPAINPSRFPKNQTFIPLPSWWSQSDWQTKLQTDRKTIKRAWNLQDTTYPFDYEDNLLSFLPQIRQPTLFEKWTISTSFRKINEIGILDVC